MQAWSQAATPAPGPALAPAPASAAAAAASPQQAIQEGLRRQEERTRDQQRTQQPDPSELTPARRAESRPAFPHDARCFVVNQIGVTGPDSARFHWLADAAMPYMRQCIGVNALGYIATELDHVLKGAGYASTRVVLPPQSLEAGQLQLRVEAGRIADIRMVEAEGEPHMPDRRWGTWRNAFPASAGDILNVRDLEQGVENMKRLPSQTVATRLEPGADASSSVVIIQRKAGGLNDRLHGGVILDNAGSPSLGRAQLSGQPGL